MNIRSSTLARWRHDQQGSVAVIYGLMLSVMMLGLVTAVDYGRAATVSQKVALALDAAALAGAKLLDSDTASDADILAAAQAYFVASTSHLAVGNVGLGTMTASIDRAAGADTTHVTGQVTSLFGQSVGITTLPIDRSATVVYKLRQVELAMALDITGSMAEVPVGDVLSKVESLKVAAGIVVDTLFDQAINERGVRIAIAPFSASVNAGSYTSLVAVTPTSCVVERSGINNATDATPAGADMLPTLDSLGATGTCPTPAITPLSGRSRRANIKSAIQGFTPDGSTAGHIGTAWAWYMLSPAWSGIFTGSNQPAAYSDRNTSKNIVIMTDGLFNTSYLTGLAAGSAPATAESYTEFNALCANIKAQGINIYTIGFGLNDAAAATELQNCASSAGNFFAAANGAQLQSAFETIVTKLNALRVSG